MTTRRSASRRAAPGSRCSATSASSGVDVLRDPFTCVGHRRHVRRRVRQRAALHQTSVQLVAAFDHRNVFIDPDPDPASSFAERKRLFVLPGSSWNDYDRSLLSPGGDVFDRKAKSVTPSKEARVALAIARRRARRHDARRADPLDPAGAGRPAVERRDRDVREGERRRRTATSGTARTTACASTGAQVRARVVGEGGNLGFTQRGRIEYARAGGRINTDFIDNSAGVDTSDHEVNWKILLGLAIQRGELTLEDRNELLQDCAPDVVQHVLYDNYLQAQILSQEEEVSAQRIEAYEDLMAAARGRRRARARRRVPADDRRDGGAPRRRAGHDAAGAGRAARLREATGVRGAAGVRSARQRVPGRRPRAVLPAR